MDDPTQEKDEQLYDLQPPPGPTPREVRRRWVEEGDVAAFMQLIVQKHWGLISVHEQLRNLLRACEVKAQKDPEGFAAETFARLVGFNAFLVLRSQLFIEQRIVGRGELPSTPSIADVSIDVAERLLPRLVEMQRGLAELLVAQAQAARLWGLARAKEAKAGAAAPANRGESRRPRSSGRKTGRKRDDVATKKIEDQREGIVPLPAPRRRRG